MKCPFCGKLNTRVVDSRPDKVDFQVRRRRECRKCSKRFTTHEKFVQVPIIIVKKMAAGKTLTGKKFSVGLRKLVKKEP